ncbi:hypothetical protein BC629DRAFT_625863 [Irpex lacteus]|nr:hypothetical protein BC629DRAFT_625863 [Irpex lacteus]
MDQQYEPQDQSDELPFWPMYGIDLLFELTVSEALASLAARIPSELFDYILLYVNFNRTSRREYSWGKTLGRNRGEPSPKDILTDLKRCSLVCLFWANRCRHYMFLKTTLQIQSYEDAEIFRRYVVGGCPRLTPVHQLIKHIYVIQNYSGIRPLQGSERHASFLHLLYLPTIQDKLEELFIEGPVPEGFNRAKLDTPHWGIPPCIVQVVPSSFLLNQIYLRNIHFPSFRHVTKYIKHFPCVTYIEFVAITWDGQMALLLPHVSTTIACQRRPRSLRIDAEGVCTNSVHLALTAVMMNPNCPLHRLSDEERVRMFEYMTLRWGDKKYPDMRMGFNVSEQATTMHASVFHFVFEEAPATDRPDSVLSVVGMHAYIHEYNKLPANFDALVNHARTQPTIRALVLLFNSLDYLQESLKPFLEVLTLVSETMDLVLAYEKMEECTAVGVDLVTLEPNGASSAGIAPTLAVLTSVCQVASGQIYQGRSHFATRNT